MFTQTPKSMRTPAEQTNVQVVATAMSDTIAIEAQEGLIPNTVLEKYLSWTSKKEYFRDNIMDTRDKILSSRAVQTTGTALCDATLILYNGEREITIPKQKQVDLLHFDPIGMLYLVKFENKIGYVQASTICQQQMMTVYPEDTKKLAKFVLENLSFINKRVKIVLARIYDEKIGWKNVVAKVVLEGTHAKEIDVWKQFRHANIAPLLCTCECFGYLFMFTERGAPLYGSNPQSEVQTFSVLKQIATGLEYLHCLGFVHLDMKIENTIVVDGVLKIIDFEGVYHEHYKDNLTNASRYSPPEALIVDTLDIFYPAWDIWSLGIMAIVLLNGTSNSWYFDVPSLLEDIQFNKHHKKVPYNISMKARKFIIDCLERDKDRRLPSGELLTRIEDVLNEHIGLVPSQIESQVQLVCKSQGVVNLIIDNKKDLDTMIYFIKRNKHSAYFASISTKSPDTVYNKIAPFAPSVQLNKYCDAYVHNQLKELDVTLWYFNLPNNYVYNIKLIFSKEFSPTLKVSKLWKRCAVVECGIPIVCRYIVSAGFRVKKDTDCIAEIKKYFPSIHDVTAISQQQTLDWVPKNELHLLSRMFGFQVIGDISEMPHSFYIGMQFNILMVLFRYSIPLANSIGMHCSVPITRFSYDGKVTTQHDNMIVGKRRSNELDALISRYNVKALKTKVGVFVQCASKNEMNAIMVQANHSRTQVFEFKDAMFTEGDVLVLPNTPSPQQSITPTRSDKNLKRKGAQESIPSKKRKH